MQVSCLLAELRTRRDCAVRPPAGLPLVPTGVELPSDLTRFYAECGGMTFASPPLTIVSPDRFGPINEIVLGDQFPDDVSSAWYLLAESDDSGTAERISIDLRPSHQGRCYDSFWDRHGLAGSMDILALSFTEFLEQLAKQGDWYFWNCEEFVALGDAYDA